MNEMSPHTNVQLARYYAALAQRMESFPSKVLYPCCGLDITPSAVFFTEEVTYVDCSRQAIETLLRTGKNACYARVPTGRDEKDSVTIADDETPLFKPDREIDLLILHNPQISPTAVAQWVRERGYVICNNYHQTADEMFMLNNFAPTAILKAATTGEIETETLEEYFVILATDDEYKERDPNMYKQIQKFVYGRFRTALPFLFDVTQAVPQYLQKIEGGMQYFDRIILDGAIVPAPLRKKESDADDLFLFQKKKRQSHTDH